MKLRTYTAPKHWSKLADMDSTNNYIKGECMDMCPESEISLRHREKLLHILEIVPGTERHKTPQTDKSRAVKSFSRSAAGKCMHDPINLRPPEVLLKTVGYLLDDILLNNKVPWHITYDFIMDRLRSVRQDMVIQNVSVAESICILQPIVRFYAYSAYSLCNESIANFDPHINKTHLQECLKRLLSLYDECDNLFSNKIDGAKSFCIKALENNRSDFEALYLVLNLGNPTALTRALNLKKKWQSETVKLAMNLSLNYYRNNFVRVGRILKKLPLLLQGMAAAIHIPEIRRKTFSMMSIAYNSKNLAFPLDVLKVILLYDTMEDVLYDCAFYGLKCREDTVLFVKNDFDNTKLALKPAHLNFIDEALNETDISKLILNDCSARRNREDLNACRPQGNQLLNHQNIAGVIVPTPTAGSAFPVQDRSGPHILQKSALAPPDSSFGAGTSFAPVIDSNNQSVEASPNNASAVQNNDYFDRNAIIEPQTNYAVRGPNKYPESKLAKGAVGTAMSQAAVVPKEDDAPNKLKFSQSGVLYTLHMIREPVVDYQESRGVPRNEEITFLTLVTSLCTQAYTAAITILVMLWNLMPLVDGLIYFIRFVLDKMIDIVKTDDNKDRAIKAAILFGELTIITFIIFMIVGLIFMPVYVLMARLFSKIFSMIAW